MRKPLMTANWKMNKTVSEAVGFANNLKLVLRDAQDVEVVICPTFVALSEVSKILEGSSAKLGAQNVYMQENGAYTGEVSPLMLKELGCKYVIIGHSERREYFKEDNELINAKLKLALKYQLRTILCVGETLAEYQNNQTIDIVKAEIREGLAGVDKEQMGRVTIAYEPIWAIGTGKTATPNDANKVHKIIRKIISDMFDIKTGEKMRIQYGGSVKPDNISALMEQSDIDGALVGGASLSVESFIKIINYGKKD
ncbi:triose-phosphate isomerase [bacterium]|nr:triose-phosphate isomerase [bacterium]